MKPEKNGILRKFSCVGSNELVVDRLESMIEKHFVFNYNLMEILIINLCMHRILFRLLENLCTYAQHHLHIDQVVIATRG